MRTIREAYAELVTRFRELLEHEDDCARCFHAARNEIKSRTPTPRRRMAHIACARRCIRGLVAWRRWCRARDVLGATERLRARYRSEVVEVRSHPALPPMPAPVEPPTDLEELERESEKQRREFARRRWWRDRRR